MVGDLTEKIQSSQNKFEELVGRLPGYSGYKRKEQRREADKLLRMHVAREGEQVLERINELQDQLSREGELRLLMVFERAVTKLQLLIDRLKTASYGYAGVFDALKVDEDVLDRLYAYDQELLQGVDEVAGLLDELEQQGGADDAMPELADRLVSKLVELNNAFSHRQDVILE